MVKKRSLKEAVCPVGRALDQMGDGWTLLIVRNALHGTRRFGDFQRELGVSKSMLATRLRQMVERGLLEQRANIDLSSFPEYHLTPKGRRLWPVLVALRQWGEAELFEAGEPMTLLIDRRDGESIRGVAVIARDGRELEITDTEVKLGAARGRARSVSTPARGQDRVVRKKVSK